MKAMILATGKGN